MALFQKSVLNTFPQDESKVALRWAEYQKFLAKKGAIKGFKEEEYQDGFFKDVFENCLGYTLKTTNPSNFNLEREKKNETDSKKADGVIYVDGEVIGVVELKDQKTKQLDFIETQAFNYHNSHSNSKYVIISNFDELRFYIDKKTAYEKFSLFSLSYEEFKKLHLLLSYESIQENIPQKLKDKSSTFEAVISKELYKDFTIFRTQLFENIIINNPDIDKSLLLRLTQKLCDRIVFILFAEDRALLRHNTIKEIREEFANQRFTDYSLYDIYKFYFEAINKGNAKLNIPKYNGGLFATDELLDSLKIDDVCLNENAQNLSNYDFVSDISVNILGHIFEQSLSDLEELNASINHIDFDKKNSKRKKDGVFYTPEYITRYIVENTLGKLCEEQKEALHVKSVEAPKNSKKPTKEEALIKENLERYKEWLLHVKILDPACGSGAFLNQALEYLIKEHKELQEKLTIMGDITAYYEIEASILENNLYGVDINEDAVEIARLSLWLRTAQKGRALANLSDKIKCANSLLEMPFEENSFDVVIGNPPYVQLQSILEMSNILKSAHYETYEGTGDLYVLFYELGYKLLKRNGLLGYISSNKWMRAKYGKSLRHYLSKNTSIKILIDLGKNIFEDATVDSNILIFEKANIEKQNCLALDLSNEKEVLDFSDYLKNALTLEHFSEENWILNNPMEQQIKNKIDTIGIALKDWDLSINFGIKTGLNEAFILDEKTKNELIAQDSKSIEIIKPLLRGRDIQRYYPSFAHQWIITTFPAKGINIDEYKAVKEYLQGFGKALEQSGEKGSRKKTGNKWFETQDTVAFYPEFEKELIIWKRIGSSLRFSLGQYHSLDSTCFLSSQYNKYLLCVLNSKMGHYLMKDAPKTGTGDLLISVQAIEPLKIPRIVNQEPFIQKADLMIELHKALQETTQAFLTELNLEKIPQKLQNFEELEFDEFVKEYTKAKKIKFVDKLEERTFKQQWQSLFENDKTLTCNLKTEIAKTDKEIDAMVYELYGLSEDEVKIVEGGI